MERGPGFEHHGKEDRGENPQFVTECTPMLSVKRMSFLDSVNMKRFSHVADKESVEDRWRRVQFFWRSEDKQGGLRVISDGIHPWNDLIINCHIRQFIQMYSIHRSTILISFLNLGCLICC